MKTTKSNKKAVAKTKKTEDARNEIDSFRAVKDASKYGFSFQRILMFFCLFVPFIVIFLVYYKEIIIYSSQAISMTLENNASAESIDKIRTPAMLIFIFLVLAGLFQILFKGVVSDNAVHKNKKLGKSFSDVMPCYFNLIVGTIIAALLGFLLSLFTFVPAVGNIIYQISSFFIGLMLMFFIQSIVISKKSVFGSFADSFDIFASRPFEVILFMIYVILFSILLFVIASIPLLIFGFPIISYLVMNAGNPDLNVLVNLITGNIASVAIGIVLSAFVVAYTILFSESAKAYFYVQARKRNYHEKKIKKIVNKNS